MGSKGAPRPVDRSASEIAAEKAEAARVAAEKKEFKRKTTPGVKLTTERAARSARRKPSLIGQSQLKETLG